MFYYYYVFYFILPLLKCIYLKKYVFPFSYISLGEFEEASKVLFRRSDAKSLELSLKLAEKTENKDLYNAVLVRFNAFANAECKNEKTEASCSTDNVEVVNSKDNEHDTKS